MVFTDVELSYLADQPLARLATIGPYGPQVNPVAYWVNAEGTVDVGGPALASSQRYRNLRGDPRVSLVVDDNASEPVGPGGQLGRGLEIRGHAELFVADEPLMDGFSHEVIRVHPRRILAWNLDGPGSNRRDVPARPGVRMGRGRTTASARGAS